MGVHDLAAISLIADDDEAVISGGGFEHRDIKLDLEPDGVFSDELSLNTVEASDGGIALDDEFPMRVLTLPFNLYDIGDGIEATISRFRKLWRPGRAIRWQVETGYSGTRWLIVRRSAGIKFSPKQDWNLYGYAHAEVTAVALQPMYESESLVVTASNPSAGSNTMWLPAWNPTDQKAWPEWALNPNGEASFSLPDFSFGNEQEIDPKWLPGDLDDRMIPVPVDGGTIDVMWSVMSEPRMDTFVAADLSNAPGQMGGVDTLFWIPPYTGTPDEPILFPVTIDGPAGAQVRLTLRRFWSAESGLEGGEPWVV